MHTQGVEGAEDRGALDRALLCPGPAPLLWLWRRRGRLGLVRCRWAGGCRPPASQCHTHTLRKAHPGGVGGGPKGGGGGQTPTFLSLLSRGIARGGRDSASSASCLPQVAADPPDVNVVGEGAEGRDPRTPDKLVAAPNCTTDDTCMWLAPLRAWVSAPAAARPPLAPPPFIDPSRNFLRILLPPGW